MRDDLPYRELHLADGVYRYADLRTAVPAERLATLPYTYRILIENLLRQPQDGATTQAMIAGLLAVADGAAATQEIGFMPARVLLQDFTGVPVLTDLAAMRDAVHAMGGTAARINPLQPVELVIDHSVQVDRYGSGEALDLNAALEFRRNAERYAFLRWGQQAFANCRIVPPAVGIVHQVNLEYLARVVFVHETDGMRFAYPDTVVGTDSHTTMINGLGVLGWGVGGIEAEAAMLGQPIALLPPSVVGFELRGRLPEGATATDLVLTVTQLLRAHGVVGKCVEFFGAGLDDLPVADRATLANMAPEYGATCGLFPIDAQTLRYLALTGRSAEQIALVEAYARAQALFRTPGEEPQPHYRAALRLDLNDVEPSLAGPKRPQDRIPLRDAKTRFESALAAEKKSMAAGTPAAAEIADGAVVIAAITSCTNTSNPAVMLAAGLVAQKAHARGLVPPPWVKTSLAPGSRVAADYLERAGLMPALEALGFHVVGYGCTTCIGNSGPLPETVSAAIHASGAVVCAVLSGNRNFEGRVHSEVRLNYLASPPLVVAYALAGRMNIDLYREPLGTDRSGQPVYLKDLWPGQSELAGLLETAVQGEQYRARYADVFAGDARWNAIRVPRGERYAWDADSTYIKRPPYFDGLTPEPVPISPVRGARVLALLGDSVTTDHISPAGSIKPDSPAGRYLAAHGVAAAEFNSYGARRGNHEVMMRGTFANIRLRNRLAGGVEGGLTRFLPGDEILPIYTAAERYAADGTPLVVIAGKEYGSGSSRDWAAKGVRLLGVRAVLAESFERIHRSNLIGMGVLPLEFLAGESAAALGLSGLERYTLDGALDAVGGTLAVSALAEDGATMRFTVRLRIDTPMEAEYFRHGGILPYVLRQLLAAQERTRCDAARGVAP